MRLKILCLQFFHIFWNFSPKINFLSTVLICRHCMISFFGNTFCIFYFYFKFRQNVTYFFWNVSQKIEILEWIRCGFPCFQYFGVKCHAVSCVFSFLYFLKLFTKNWFFVDGTYLYGRVLKKTHPSCRMSLLWPKNRKIYYSALIFFFAQAVHWYSHCFLTTYIYEDTAGGSTVSHY